MRLALPYELRTVLPDSPTDFMAAYHFGPTLKTRGGLTPYEYISKV